MFQIFHEGSDSEVDRSLSIYVIAGKRGTMSEEEGKEGGVRLFGGVMEGSVEVLLRHERRRMRGEKLN